MANPRPPKLINPAAGVPKKRTAPQGKPKPMPPTGSSKKNVHPSVAERVAMIGRKTKNTMTEIRRRGPRGR